MTRPTLQDVALAAGVSHMTVSRVLHGTQVVKPSTVQRVREAVQKLGYRPDPALSALSTYRRKSGGKGLKSIVALIDCDKSWHSRELFAGAAAEASLLGYECEVIPLPTGVTKQRQLSRTLFHRGIRGLLFGPAEQQQEFKGWEWSNFAFVSLGALCHRPSMHAVSLDYFHGAISACERLREAGRRRIALVIDPAKERRTGGLWLGGYAAGVLHEHLPLVCPPEILPDEARLPAWLRKNGTDGIITIHLALASVFLHSGIETLYLNQEGEGLPFAHYHLPNHDIGREGVRLLHHALLRHEFGLPAETKHVALRGIWLPPPATG